MTPTSYQQQWRIIASWQLLAELARRHPTLWVVEAHHASGLYDCLELCRPEPEGTIVQVNRSGSIQHEPWWSSPDSGWAALALDGPRRTAVALEEVVNLPSPSQTPPTTPKTLVYGLISRLLAGAAASEDAGGLWDCRCGFSDGPAGVGPVPSLFDRFSEARKRVDVHAPDDPLGEPHNRFWFLLRDHVPVAAFETTGTMWTPDGTELDLTANYDQHGRSITVLATEAWRTIADSMDEGAEGE